MNIDIKKFEHQLTTPPIHHFLRGKIERVERKDDWFAEISYQPRAEFANPLGHVQGGMICAILDDSMGMFALIAENGQHSVTVTMNVSFLRPCLIESLRVHVYFVRQGSKILSIESVAFQNNKEVAKASAAFMKVA